MFFITFSGTFKDTDIHFTQIPRSGLSEALLQTVTLAKSVIFRKPINNPILKSYC